MNNSAALVQAFERYGIKDCFCVTGGHSLFLNEAFYESQQINVTYFHHEQAAAMAADSYFRINNVPAIVNISAGPAALNTLNGVYGSYVDSIPVIFISGQPKFSQLVRSTGLNLRQYGDQEFDKITDLVDPIVKSSILMGENDDPFFVAYNAYHIACAERPGPVWIDVPMNIQSLEYISSDNLPKTHFQSSVPRNQRGLTRQQLGIIFEKLSQSSRPVICAGPISVHTVLIVNFQS